MSTRFRRCPLRLSAPIMFGTFLLAALLSLSMGMVLSPPSAQAQTFKDVRSGDWFYEAVEALASEGAAAGYTGGTFRPYEPVTRAQFAVMMAGVLHLAPGDGTVFNDVRAGDWFAGAVGALYHIGVVQGSASGRFSSGSDISRQQAASLAMRAVAYRLCMEAPDEPDLTYEGTPPTPLAVLMTDPSEVAPWLAAFRDRGAIAPTHVPAVANAYRAGIVAGFADQRFYPLLDLTRGQAAGILHAALLLPLAMSEQPPAPVPTDAAYPTLGRGASGPVVAWAERRLAALSYRPGALDGLFDGGTADAVMAFQKVQRLQRTGTLTDAVLQQLASATGPAPQRSATGSRVEIDLTRQVLFLIQANRVQWTIPIASGAEGTRTPTGAFTIQRKLPYWRESHLGLLYKPAYFYGGYAIHGSHSVPAHPASHGCVRVAVSTMDSLYPLLPIGTRVDVYY